MMTETSILVAGAIFVSGLIAEVFAVVTAPVGFQDERGFQLVIKCPARLLTGRGKIRADKHASAALKLMNVNQFILTKNQAWPVTAQAVPENHLSGKVSC